MGALKQQDCFQHHQTLPTQNSFLQLGQSENINAKSNIQVCYIFIYKKGYVFGHSLLLCHNIGMYLHLTMYLFISRVAFLTECKNKCLPLLAMAEEG